MTSCAPSQKPRVMRTRCTGASSARSVRRFGSACGKAWASACGDSSLPIKNSPAGTRAKTMPKLSVKVAPALGACGSAVMGGASEGALPQAASAAVSSSGARRRVAKTR